MAGERRVPHAACQSAFDRDVRLRFFTTEITEDTEKKSKI